MKVIQSWEAIETLPIPKSICASLKEELLHPFDGDESALIDFWHEVGGSLYLLEPQDSDSELEALDDETQQALDFITQYPELVLLLDDATQRYLLALAIFTDAGAGAYLLAPLSSTTHVVTTLTPLIETGESV